MKNDIRTHLYLVGRQTLNSAVTPPWTSKLTNIILQVEVFWLRRIQPQHHSASQLRRLRLEISPPWKPQNSQP